MKQRKLWSIADLIVIVVLFLGSFTALFYLSQHAQDADTLLSIQVDGVEKARFALREGQNQTYAVETSYGTNILRIEGKTVRMEQADCKDQLCVHQGSISLPGQMIVCLPHRVLVEIIGEEQTMDIRTH